MIGLGQCGCGAAARRLGLPGLEQTRVNTRKHFRVRRTPSIHHVSPRLEPANAGFTLCEVDMSRSELAGEPYAWSNSPF